MHVVETENPIEKAVEKQTEDVSTLNHYGALTFKSRKVTFIRPSYELTQHLRPLYVSVFMNGIKVRKITVDNGEAVNILPQRMMKKLNARQEDLLQSNIIVSGKMEM